MNLSTTTRRTIWLTVFLWTITVRSVYTNFHGGDTLANFVKVMQINEAGSANWLITELSFFGWYPLSYPTGEFILVSAAVQLSGLSIYQVIYYFSFIQAFFGLLTYYLFARLFFKDDVLSFLSVILFSVTFLFVSYTGNVLTARSLFILFYPVVIFFIFKLRTTTENYLPTLLCLLWTIITLASIHRLILYFMGCIIFPLVVYSIFCRAFPNFRLSDKKYYNPFLYVLFSFVALAQITGLIQVGVDSSNRSYSVIEGTSWISWIINTAATYGGWYGPAVVLMPFGLLGIISEKSKNFSHIVIIFVCFIGIFFVRDLQYFLIFFTPFGVILGVKGLWYLYQWCQSHNRFSYFFALFIPISWFLEYNHLLEDRSYVLLALSIFGLYITLKIIMSSKIKGTKSRHRIVSLSMGLLILSASSVFTAITLKSLSEHDNYPESGMLLLEQQSNSRARWLAEYSQGDFLANSRWLRNDIWTRSEVECAVHYYDAATNPLIIAELEPEFDATLIFTSGQKAFENHLDSRYNPTKAEASIFYGDDYLAESYETTIFLIDLEDSCQEHECRIGTSNQFTETCMCFEYAGMIQSLEEDRYVIFSDLRVKMYHYSAYS